MKDRKLKMRLPAVLTLAELSLAMLSLVMALVSASVQADSHFDSGSADHEPSPSSNPWQLAPRVENPVDFRRLPKYRSREYRPDSEAFQGRVDRFVTPEILQSIEQQQTRNQLLYGQPHSRSRRQPPAPLAPYSDPLYDVPPVAPWGGASDLIYRGQDMPLVPPEALGGLSPLPAFDPLYGPAYGGSPYPGLFPGSAYSGGFFPGGMPGFGSGARNDFFSPFGSGSGLYPGSGFFGY